MVNVLISTCLTADVKHGATADVKHGALLTISSTSSSSKARKKNNINAVQIKKQYGIAGDFGGDIIWACFGNL